MSGTVNIMYISVYEMLVVLVNDSIAADGGLFAASWNLAKMRFVARSCCKAKSTLQQKYGMGANKYNVA